MKKILNEMFGLSTEDDGAKKRRPTSTAQMQSDVDSGQSVAKPSGLARFTPQTAGMQSDVDSGQSLVKREAGVLNKKTGKNKDFGEDKPEFGAGEEEDPSGHEVPEFGQDDDADSEFDADGDVDDDGEMGDGDGRHDDAEESPAKFAGEPQKAKKVEPSAPGLSLSGDPATLSTLRDAFEQLSASPRVDEDLAEWLDECIRAIDMAGRRQEPTVNLPKFAATPSVDDFDDADGDADPDEDEEY